jgi:hypothetical protein
MESPEIDIRIREWLSGTEGQAVLESVARAVSASARVRRLSPVFLMNDAFGEYAPEDLITDVRSELALFIIENSTRLSVVLTSDNSNPFPFLKQAFINHWITKTRATGKDPQRSFYKRMQDVMRHAQGFHLLSKGQGPLYFSLTSDNKTTPRLCEEDILSIQFPVDLPRQCESINTKNVLLRLARHFWERVSKMWGDIAVWVDMRDLVDWIRLHVSLKAPMAHKEDPGGDAVIDGVPDDAGNPGALYYDRDMVIEWAGHFSNRLTQKERDVFRLSYGADLNLREVAHELNYKGSSGPKYILECVNGKLRLFLRDLPWLSPDDFNREAFSLFIDTIISILKKAPKKP